MMRLFDPQHAFFRPKWRRITITGACLVWACVEAWLGNTAWAIMFACLGIYCGYQFFVAPEDSSQDDP